MIARPLGPDSAHRFIVAYDVSNDPRRSRVAKTLESYGDRIQFSVFVLDIKPARMTRLRASLSRLIDPEADSVLFCDLGPLSHGGLNRVSYIGLSRTITGQGPLII